MAYGDTEDKDNSVTGATGKRRKFEPKAIKSRVCQNYKSVTFNSLELRLVTPTPSVLKQPVGGRASDQPDQFKSNPEF
jgi:hypothetical protein